VSAGEPVQKDEFKRVEKDNLTFFIIPDYAASRLKIRLRFFVFGEPLVSIRG